MNSVETYQILNPENKEDICAKFTVDDITMHFDLNNITTIGGDYVFSAWVKSDAEGGIIANGEHFATSTEWRKITLQFTATNVDFSMLFTTVGTYYIYHSKLEVGNKATDWTPAPEDSIKTMENEYYLSTSATSLEGGSWSTIAPTWVNGKYMWCRTVTTDGAGNKTYSPSQNGVCIAGAKGDTGTGVSSMTPQYYLSTSKTSATGGSWSDTAPSSVPKGKYLWTRLKVVYTNPSSTEYTTATYESMADSRIEQLKDSITLEVTGADGTKSSIAMDDEGKINLTGDVIAERINVDNLMARNITATGDIQFDNNYYRIITDPDKKSVRLFAFNKLSLEGMPVTIDGGPDSITLSAQYGVRVVACQLIAEAGLVSPDNNFISHTNEFNYVPAGYSDHVWFNYRTQGGTSNGTVNAYYFGNGQGGQAPIYCSGMTVNGSRVDDYVIAQGISGSWRYRKWASGIAECWGWTGWKTVDVTTAWGGVYVAENSTSNFIGALTYPFEMSSIYYFATPEIQNGDYWLLTAASNGSSTTTPYWQAARGASKSGLNIGANIYVCGRY